MATLTNAAVPGAAWPGAGWPGQALVSGGPLPPGVTEALFSGPEALVYPSYIDTEVEHTLTAEPGQTYEIEPPPGTNQPAIPPDGFWTAE